MREFDVITFDCYGTLIDWRSGIRDAFAAAASEHGIEVDGGALLDAYNRFEPEVEHERYRTYRDVLTETATRAAASGVARGGARLDAAGDGNEESVGIRPSYLRLPRDRAGCAGVIAKRRPLGTDRRAALE